MNQEYRSKYLPIPATTIPYWDETCGETFYEKHEFLQTLQKFENNLNHYKPRDFILNNLSPSVCQELFINLIDS
jgi:hypothetical protein